jgi:hypothetical protein
MKSLNPDVPTHPYSLPNRRRKKKLGRRRTREIRHNPDSQPFPAFGKVRLSLCLIKHYAMKAYWGVGV